MNHLFIIFSENGKLHTSCPELINTTYKHLLIDTKLCFLNGKQDHIRLEYNDSIEESGILLVYDAHNNAAHDKGRTLTALKNISMKYKHLYVCYHHGDGKADEWEQEIENLNLNWETKPITKHHYEEPYKSLLHEFHLKYKTIEDLIEFWHMEEEAVNENKIREMLDLLFYALHEAKDTNNVQHLDLYGSTVSQLSFTKQNEFIAIKQMIINNANEAKFNEAANNFRINKITV